MATRAYRLADTLIPQTSDLRLDQVQITHTSVTVTLSSTALTAACPQCHQCATRIRGTYVRTLADLP